MMAVDTDGNVFVTGQVAGTAPQTLMATWKYDSNGAPMWGTSTAPYEAYAPLPIQKLNYGAAVTPDGAGGCWAAGGVTKDGEGLNIAVIHYDSNGNILSPTPFLWNNHLQNGDDYPVVVALDGASNVWVGGVSSGSGTGADFFIIGIDSLTGTVLGYDRYDGPSNKTDVLVDMKVYSVASSGSGGGGSGVGLSVVGTSFDNTTKNDAVILHYTWNGLALARTTNSPIRYTNGGGASNEVATAMEVWFNGADIDTFVVVRATRG